jgi:UDP-N-acetylglucosamine 2-epimerase
MDELLQLQRLKAGGYFIATIHRAENTDDSDAFGRIVDGLNRVAEQVAPVLWPIHPRAKARMDEIDVTLSANVRLLDPIGYTEMQGYLAGARGVLTDSGGLQKEAAFHGLPTITLRNETEWPETVEQGYNILVGADPVLMAAAAAECDGKGETCNGFGNGNAAVLIAQSIKRWVGYQN